MKIVRFADADFAERLAELTTSSSLFDPIVEQRTREIVEAVRLRGDAALSEFTERFDGARLAPEQFEITHAELMSASLKADDNLRKTIAEAQKNIAAFAKKSLRKNWSMHNSHGATVGEKFDPFQRVGIYVPGGTAPLVSTALMTITLAKVAGCKEIVVCTPAGKTGEINSALLFAIRAAGATEIYRIGGAQAMPAMALDTPTIRFVQKIFGPGNSTSSQRNACWSATSRLIFCPVPAKCSCLPTTLQIPNSLPPICSRKRSMVPVTNASGW